MQIIRQNCTECVGSRREECDAIFAQFRTEVGNTFVSTIEDAFDATMDDDMVGLMEIQEKSATIGLETRVAIKGIGCTLTDAQLMTAAASELIAGIDLAVADAEEEAEKQAAEDSIERITGLLEEANEMLVTGRQAVADAKEHVADSMQAAAKEYCEERGLDIDNLGFVDNMDLRGHLRSRGHKLD